jgi:hypothetical protein
MNNKKYILGLIATALVAEQVTLMRANRVIKKQHQSIKDLEKGMLVADAMLREPDISTREDMQSYYRMHREFNLMTHKF